MTSMADAGSGSQAPLPQGTLVAGRFALEEPLPGAASVSVYLARDTQSNAPCTVLLAPLQRLGAHKTTLQSDLGRVARVQHKNLARLFAVGEESGFLYTVSEHADGHTLRRAIAARLQQGQTVGAQTAFTLLGHVAQGLSAAYAAMAHGALSPENIVVGRDGRVVIEHLGLFHALAEIAWRGLSAEATSPYVAPELARGGLPTAAADVYSMGAMLYEMLTGAPPAGQWKPPSQTVPGLSSMVDAVVMKALAASPLGRQGSPQMLVNEFGAAMGFSDAAASGAMGAARSTGGLSVPRVTGRTFNVAEAAGMDVDSERWLVQKGRLDFGPFTMNQLKAEIAKGTFGPNDLLTDTENGEQVPIKEHPQLADFSKQAARSLEQARRAQANQSMESTERKKSRFTALIIGAAGAVVVAGAVFYFINRQNQQQGALASRAEEADIDAFLKNVKIEFNQNKKPRAARRGGGGGSAKGGDEFNTDMVIGDVSKGGGDAVLNDDVIQRVMMGNYRKLVPCIMSAKGVSAIDLEFVIRGSGEVSAVKVNGERNGALPSCVLSRMKSFGFPKFDGSKTVASWSMSLR
ncbi:MAG: protein kinase [Deltaproteobacteria bacterium]|nr:protein kinase [Deltaproteobacteria bacterium]